MATVLGAMFVVVVGLAVRVMRKRNSSKHQQVDEVVVNDNVSMAASDLSAQTVESRATSPEDLASQLREKVDVLF